MNNQNIIETDILVVGAGPVGMILSSVLRQNGVNVLLIEKRQERVSLPRAIAVNQATLDVFHMLELKSLIENGVAIDHIDVYWKNKSIGQFNFHDLEIESPHFFHIPQNEVEKELEKKLERLQVSIQKGYELIRYEQDEDAVIAEIKTSENGSLTVRANYLIGCDGGQSTVRELMGCGIDQRAYGASFLLADVQLKGEHFSETQYIFAPDGYAMIVPLPEDRYRLIFSMKANDPILQSKNGVYDAAFIEGLLLSRSGYSFQIEELIWTTSAAFGHRLSKVAVDGRVILAGDAMHQFSPVGGTNMNVGIQDAISLAWRLIAMKNSSPSLLGDYALERQGLVERQQYLTEWATALMTRTKNYPVGDDPKMAVHVLDFQKQLTGFILSNDLVNIQLCINHQILKSCIEEIRGHFVRARYVLVTQGSVSAVEEEAIANFLKMVGNVVWVRASIKGEFKFFFCRPDGLVIAQGNAEQLRNYQMI